MIRNLRRLLLVLAVAFVSAVTAAVPVIAQPVPEVPVLTGIRVGQHATFDRIVLDLSGPRPESIHHQYVQQLTEDGSGKPVSLPGRRFLAASVQGMNAHDENGNPTYTGPRKFRTPALRNVQAVALTGDFEAVVSIGLGLDHRSWVHTFMLDGPTRVVIDIGH